VSAAPPGRVLVGGVGYRWFGDGSFALLASDELSALDWPPGVDVLDLGYGALHVAMDLADADRMYEAGAGVVDLDHLLVIGRHFGGLPDDVVAIELEPEPGTTGDQLSAAAQALLPRAVELVRHEALAPARLPTRT
jgi:Ni,Fe-hydrogenase maturation factor